MEKPILFSTPMVQAILAGIKTQTRREIKPQPRLHGRHFGRISIYNRNGNTWEVKDNLSECGFSTLDSFKCPYGKVGDVLWVREEHYRFGHWEQAPERKRKSGRMSWKFVPDSTEVRYFDNAPDEFRKGRHHKDPSIPAWHKRLARFMPKGACRIRLRITNVRVERLQDITEEDAMAEGASPSDKYMTIEQRHHNYNHPSNKIGWSTRAGFETLWQSINGEQSWKDNPWVWVIEFERIQ